MKRTFKQTMLLAVLTLIVVGLTFAGGTKKVLPYSSGSLVSQVSVTVASADIDTLIYRVEPGLATLTFFAYSPDSVNYDLVTLRRVSTMAGGNTVNLPIAGTADTLAEFTAYAPNAVSQGAASVKFAPITLSPLPEQIWFVVDKGTNIGVTSKTGYYGVIKTYYK